MKKLILMALITFISYELNGIDSCLWQALSGGGYKGKVGVAGLIACSNDHTNNLKSAKELEDAYTAFLTMKNDIMNYLNQSQANLGTQGPKDVWSSDGSVDDLSWSTYESLRLLCQGCEELQLEPLSPGDPLVESANINYKVSCKKWSSPQSIPQFCSLLKLTPNKSYLDLNYQEYTDFLKSLDNSFLGLGATIIYGISAGIKLMLQGWDPANTHGLEILALKE